MGKRGLMGISNRAVSALSVETDTIFWDRRLTGFGVRVYPTGGKVFLAHARGPKGPKRVRVGRHGVLNAEQARQRAALIIARIKAGEEPRPEPMTAKDAGPTVAEVAQRYLDDYVAVRVKPGTALWIRSTLNRHIVPAFGKVPMRRLERKQVVALHQRLCDTPTRANQVVRTLSQMFRLADGWGLVPEGINPCRGITGYPQRNRERFLTDRELDRLGEVLAEAESGRCASAPAIAALRLLLLTGCRKNEILSLRWEHVALDAGELRLPDTKTGARTIALPAAAVKLLKDLPRTGGNLWVLPGRMPGKHLTDMDKSWHRIRERAGLRDVRIHDLRHSYASRALALGESLPMIGRLLGHRRIETTARYAHLAQESVQASAERIAESLAEDLQIGLADG